MYTIVPVSPGQRVNKVGAQVQAMMGSSCKMVKCGEDIILVKGVPPEAIEMPVHAFGQRLPTSKKMLKKIRLKHENALHSKEMIRHFSFSHL